MARATIDAQVVESDGWRGSVRAFGASLGKVLGLRDEEADAPQQRAMALLAQRLDDDVKRSTETLIRLHGLDGRAGDEVLARLARHYATRMPVGEGKAALWGGALTGALAGLKADIASGGLTLGGGLLAGGVLGALAAAGAARGVNLVRGTAQPEVRWDPKVLDALFANALLGYLAIAHHGRGRGAWVAQEPPAAWIEAVEGAAAQHSAALQAAWQQPPADEPGREEAMRTRLQRVVEAACADVLARLYPQAEHIAAGI